MLGYICEWSGDVLGYIREWSGDVFGDGVVICVDIVW